MSFFKRPLQFYSRAGKHHTVSFSIFFDLQFSRHLQFYSRAAKKETKSLCVLQ
jgi:hypothetical protein